MQVYAASFSFCIYTEQFVCQSRGCEGVVINYEKGRTQWINTVRVRVLLPQYTRLRYVGRPPRRHRNALTTDHHNVFSKQYLLLVLDALQITMAKNTTGERLGSSRVTASTLFNFCL